MAEYPFIRLRNSEMDVEPALASGGVRYLHAPSGYLLSYMSVRVGQIHLCFVMSESLRNRVIHTCVFGCNLCPISQMELVDATGADMTSGQRWFIVSC